MCSLSCAKMTTVAFEAIGWKIEIGSKASRVREKKTPKQASVSSTKTEVRHIRSVPWPSRLISNILIAPLYPIRCSVMHAMSVSSSLNATRFTAVGNSQLNKHLPVWTSQSFMVLSAEPDTRNLDSANEYKTRAEFSRLNRGGRRDAQSTSMVHIVPLCPSYVPRRSPLCVNQTFIRWSFEQLNSRSPSRLYLI